MTNIGPCAAFPAPDADRRQGPLSRRARRAGFLGLRRWTGAIALAAALAGSPFCAARLAHAADEPAAATAGPLSSTRDRNRNPGGDGHLLLGEGATPASSHREATGVSILAAFDLSDPDDVEEKVAKDYQLEIVSRLKLPNLGWRIVRYRVLGPTSADAVVARLRADQRVSIAQANIDYVRLDPKAPEAAIGRPKKAAATPPTDDAGHKRRAARAFRAGTKEALLIKPAPSRETAGEARTGRPARLTVGDIISGGL